MEIRNSPLRERVRDSAIIGAISGVLAGIHQKIVGSSVAQILESSSSEGIVTLFSSSLNLWLYDLMKKYGKSKTKLTNNEIILSSIGILSVWVGVTRGLVHAYVGTKNPEHLALIFGVGNALSSLAYEKVALQNNFINNLIERIRLGLKGSKK